MHVKFLKLFHTTVADIAYAKNSAVRFVEYEGHLRQVIWAWIEMIFAGPGTSPLAPSTVWRWTMRSSLMEYCTLIWKCDYGEWNNGQTTQTVFSRTWQSCFILVLTVRDRRRVTLWKQHHVWRHYSDEAKKKKKRTVTIWKPHRKY